MKIFGKDISRELAVIAEIGVNHEGSLDKAVDLLHEAAEAGASAVKFQSFTPSKYVSAVEPERLERVKKFCLDESAHDRLKSEADKAGVSFLSTAVSEDWVGKISELSDVIKISSGDLNFEPVIRSAARSGKIVILSVGLGTTEEIDQAVQWFNDELGDVPIETRLILMHCVVAYPTPIEQANVLSVPFLRERYGLVVGYSNHVIGPEACYAAVALGANLIEVHFTDQKEGRAFRDHALSFEPNDLRQLVKTATLIKSSLGKLGKIRVESEIPNIEPMRKGIVAKGNLASGTVLEERHISYARPARGFLCTETGLALGGRLKNDIAEGMPIGPDDLEG